MTSTVREQIMAAITTLLAGTEGAVGVFRSRPEALSRAESPALLIEWIQDQPQENVINYLQNLLGVRIWVITRGETPDQLADPIIASLHSLIMADLTLGGLAQDIRPNLTTLQIDEADQNAAMIACDYTVMYRTKITDLTVST